MNEHRPDSKLTTNDMDIDDDENGGMGKVRVYD
jgi:hypothetical protein